MYSGGHKLGVPPPEMVSNEWYAQGDDENVSDLDFVSAEFLSPDAGYPPQRIGNYNVQMAQHQTLNGVGLGKLPAQGRIGMFFGTLARTRTGAPVRAAAMYPRTAQPSRMTAPMGTYVRR
jgi:hypothetical protein